MLRTAYALRKPPRTTRSRRNLPSWVNQNIGGLCETPFTDSLPVACCPHRSLLQRRPFWWRGRSASHTFRYCFYGELCDVGLPLTNSGKTLTGGPSIFIFVSHSKATLASRSGKRRRSATHQIHNPNQKPPHHTHSQTRKDQSQQEQTETNPLTPHHCSLSHSDRSTNPSTKFIPE